ncbi:MAG: insulinase family protein [Bacteroidales bacterium]|nr:insulinase family protein [Bacteroidales bacterium]
MKTFRKLLFMAVLLGISLFASAQQLVPVPMDPQIRYGKLDNGLTYYIRKNQQPKERAEFYIAQNVGAILENDDQNGLAHFLEHMAFNGTKHYPGKLLIEYFESIGVKFGTNINAYTSLDETVYNLSDVPTTRQSVIDSALLVLHDWSSFITLAGEEIDNDRGVIREEWRTGAGAERRMWKASNYLKYPGSQYAKRDVIGDTAVINNFSHKAIRDYYEKWYRPDLQAIYVIGDVDVDWVEQRIKTMFADIPAKPNAGERPVYEIADNVEPIISVVKDKEARMTRIELEYKHKKLPQEVKLSMAGYLTGVLNQMISTIMGYRFDEITQRADAPFVGGYAMYGELVKSTDAFQLLVVPKEGKELEGLAALLSEAEKLRRFGFTNSEVERAKSELMKSMENAYNDRENQKNRNLVREYVRHYLDAEPIPGIEWEYQTLQQIMPHVTADRLNQIVKNYVTDENLIVSFMAPDKPSVIIPTNEQVLATLDAVKKAEYTANKEDDINRPLIAKVPKAGKIKKVSTNATLGTTEWVLKNGVTVVFKPTEFKKDEILLSAFSEGGVSKVKNTKDIISASMAAQVVVNNGLGSFSQVDLNKVLAGKMASVSPQIGSYTEGFNGRSSVSDFETMMQLVHLYFTAPRTDKEAFASLMNMYKASLANAASDPRIAFNDSVTMMVNNRHPRTVVLNMNTIELLDQERALAIFKERFGMPGDFTFVFTGNINPDDPAVRQAILTYLGGLKSKSKKETFTDVKIRKPRGLANNHFQRKMEINKASNFILYSGQLPYTMVNRTAMTAIGNILNMRYLESIREKEGGSYGVGVRGSASNTPIEEGIIMMQFDTDPEKQQRLMAIIHKEVDDIVKKGPREDDLQKVKENMLKKYSEDLRENNWWQSTIVSYYQDELNFVDDYTKAVNALTPQFIQETLKRIVDQGNVMEVVMKPAE